MNKLPRLKKQIEEEGDHTEKKHAIAKDTARGSYLLGAICAGAAAVAISFPPLWITLPHIGAATCAAAAGVIGVSADLYADKEKGKSRGMANCDIPRSDFFLLLGHPRHSFDQTLRNGFSKPKPLSKSFRTWSRR